MKILILVLLITPFSFGQHVGHLSGNLLNDSLIAIPNAYIFVGKLINQDSFEEILSLRADQEGCFSIDELPVGSYQLRIQLNLHVYSDWMELEVEITSNGALNLDELIYRESVMCMCEMEIVPHKPPLLDSFGSSRTFTRDDLRMR